MLEHWPVIITLSLIHIINCTTLKESRLNLYQLTERDNFTIFHNESHGNGKSSFHVTPIQNYTRIQHPLTTLRIPSIPDVSEAAAILTISSPGESSPTKIVIVISTPVPSKSQSLKTVIFYGFLGVTLTNLCSLGGIICIPVSRHRLYHLVLTFMTSLAVGALVSTALLVLVPESMRMVDMPFDFGGQGRSYLWKMSFIIVGLLIFFILEYLLHILPRLMKWNTETIEDGDLPDDDIKKWPERPLSIIVKNPVISKDGDILSISPLSFETDKNETKFSRKKWMNIAPVAWMILLGDGIHNLMDGLTIGAGFSNSPLVGITLSLSILFEELPHELGDFAILISSGLSVKAALISNFISSCSAYVGLGIGIAIGEVSSAALYVFAITAGIFLYISLSDMLPTLRIEIQEAEEKNGNSSSTFLLQLAGLVIGFVCVLTTTICSDFINL